MVDKVPGRNILVVGEALKEVLERNWDATNTDGIFPKFYFAHDSKRFRAHGQDAVIVTNLEEFPTPASLGYNYENVMYSGNIYAITNRSYAAGVKMKEELRRVLMSVRINPFKDVSDPNSGVLWLKVRRYTDQAYRTKRFGRWNCDFEIHHRGRAVDENGQF